MTLEARPELEDESEKTPAIDPKITERAMAEAMERKRKQAWQKMTSR